ncbi:MAG: hypothetical protein HY074_16570, partial [Deltaproteobacteria bacterium]|nr:hypothetical protein [Deltaproteobacteria bacterium]
MKIYLYELSETPKLLHFSEQDPWLAEVVKVLQEAEPPKTSGKNPIYSVDLELRQLQEVVFLKSKLALELGMLCSRCANNFEFKLNSSFQCMFTRDKGLGEQTENVG